MCPITLSGAAIAATAATAKAAAAAAAAAAAPTAAAASTTATTAAAVGFFTLIAPVALPVAGVASVTAGAYGIYKCGIIHKIGSWHTATAATKMMSSTATTAASVEQTRILAEVHNQTSFSLGSKVVQECSKTLMDNMLNKLQFHEDSFHDFVSRNALNDAEKIEKFDERLFSMFDSGKCPVISDNEDLEEFIRISEEAFSRNPKEKFFYRGAFKKCLKEFSEKSKLTTSQTAILSTFITGLGVAITTGVNNTATNKVQEWFQKGSRKQAEDDAYLLGRIERGECSDIDDVEAFQKVVQEVFSRHPTRAVALQTNFKKCLEESRSLKQDKQTRVNG